MQKFLKRLSPQLRHSHRRLMVGVLLTGAICFSGCALTPTELEKIRPPSLPKKAPPLRAGELPKITVIAGGSESYWNQAKLGAEAAGKKFGARVEWRVPAGDLVKSQKKLVEEAMKTSHGLVLAPVDSTKLMQPAGYATRAGLAVVTFNRDVFTVQNRLCFVHNDDAQTEALRQKGKEPALIAPDYYQMGFQSVKAIMDYRVSKQVPPRDIKIAPRVLTKNSINSTNRSTP